MALLHEVLDESTRWAGTRQALEYEGRRFTYRELQERTHRVARGLENLGIHRGDRVAIYLQNSPEVIEVAIACSRIGAICVPLNPLLKSRQLDYMLRNCGARTVVSSDALWPAVESRIAESMDLPCLITFERQASSRTSGLAYSELLEVSASPVRSNRCIDNDAALILYTSSSTGLPKGVIVSHRNIVSGAENVAAYLGNNQHDRILAALPLSFDYGLSQVTTALSVGACAILIQYSTASALIDEVEARAITGLGGVPTMWAQLVNTEWPAAAGASLRYITNSGGVLGLATLRHLQKRIPQAQIFCMYGLTEAFRSTYLDPEEIERRPNSIGKAIPNQEVFVLRPDGSECDVEEPGELVHRGSQVTLGYWNDPLATQERFRPLPRRLSSAMTDEIAVWSGDVVKRDSEGYLYFVGRKDHQIKTSGHRVSPTEIEEIAMEVPEVAEVVVIGLPDDRLGQRLVLVFVTAAQNTAALAENLRQHCRKHLPMFMVPVDIVSWRSIPRTPNGKHDRAAVQALLRDIEQDSAASAQTSRATEP